METPRGLITLGAQIFGGLEQKGVKSLQECIKVNAVLNILQVSRCMKDKVSGGLKYYSKVDDKLLYAITAETTNDKPEVHNLHVSCHFAC